MNLLGSFDMFVAICDDAGIIISLFIIYIYTYPNSKPYTNPEPNTNPRTLDPKTSPDPNLNFIPSSCHTS